MRLEKKEEKKKKEKLGVLIFCLLDQIKPDSWFAETAVVFLFAWLQTTELLQHTPSTPHHHTSNLNTPFCLTMISGLSGWLLSSSMGTLSLVNTLQNWLLRMSALALLSLKVHPFLLRGNKPAVLHLLLFTNCKRLFVVSLATISLTNFL